MFWTTLSCIVSMLSTLATGLTMRSLQRNWDLQVSSVRWSFFMFFVYVFVWCLSRAAYFLWILTLPSDAIYDSTNATQLDHNEFDQIAIHAVIVLREARTGWVAAMLCVGDAALCGVALWMYPLTFELSQIATRSMDRGAVKEQQRIRRYNIIVHTLIALFIVLETTLAISNRGYTTATRACLMGIYCIQFVSLAFMLTMLVRLKLSGRKYETIHGVFVASPIYERLKRIIVVYACFSFQFQVSSVVLFASGDEPSSTLLSIVGVSIVVYQATGLALAITTSCSQACVLDMCSCCLPLDVEAQLTAQILHGEPPSPGPLHPGGLLIGSGGGNAGGGGMLPPTGADGHAVESTEPPRVNPVFVFTDIESSSALWAIGDGRIMQHATELHDNILRAALLKYRGYEITTAGDSFQLAFHTIREAVEYCLDVQLQLLVAHWPKALHGLVPATRKQRAGYRLIFGGLRVRMGIHDAADSDGTLVQNTHAVTGKRTYTGASEVIANEVGDLGDGGQILVTQRVAEWLQLYEDLVAIECRVSHVGAYAIPQINAFLEVYQVTPDVLAGRKKVFSKQLRRRAATLSFAGAPASIGSHSSGGSGGNGGGGPIHPLRGASARLRLQSLDQRAIGRHASQRNFTIPQRIGYYSRATSM